MALIEYLSATPPLLFLAALLFGLIMGSFLNVVIYRLPIILERRWRADCSAFLGVEHNAPSETPFNLMRPRSSCPSCTTPIRAIDNIPVLSWLLLRGKCSHCGAHISIQYPCIELLTGLLTLIVVMHFGGNATTLWALSYLYALFALSAIDFKTTLLPDDITLPLLWLGLIANATGVFTDLHSAVMGAVLGYLSLYLVFHAFKLLTGKEGMGYGDFKLLAAIGAWLGWQQLPLVILLSSVLGTVIGVGLILLRQHDKNRPIPFGPYLAIAAWVAMLWGTPILDAYLAYPLN